MVEEVGRVGYDFMTGMKYVYYTEFQSAIWTDSRNNENELRGCFFLCSIGMSNRKDHRWDRMSMANVPSS